VDPNSTITLIDDKNNGLNRSWFGFNWGPKGIMLFAHAINAPMDELLFKIPETDETFMTIH